MSSLVLEQRDFALDVARLLMWCHDNGWTVTLGEAFRTAEQQAIYVKTGRSQTMSSNHLRRLAVDLNFFKNGALCYDRELLAPVGAFWESLNPQNRWGGNFKSFKDVPHFERNVA